MPELYIITPRDFGIALLVWVALSLLAAVGGMWVRCGHVAEESDEPEVTSEPAVDPEATVEINAPQCGHSVSEDATVVIERVPQ